MPGFSEYLQQQGGGMPQQGPQQGGYGQFAVQQMLQIMQREAMQRQGGMGGGIPPQGQLPPGQMPSAQMPAQPLAGGASQPMVSQQQLPPRPGMGSPQGMGMPPQQSMGMQQQGQMDPEFLQGLMMAQRLRQQGIA